jgi:hypothetical protein
MVNRAKRIEPVPKPEKSLGRRAALTQQHAKIAARFFRPDPTAFKRQTAKAVCEELERKAKARCAHVFLNLLTAVIPFKHVLEQAQM